MYREESEKQHKLEDFYMPFGGHLNEENRWVILSKKVPWKELKNEYKGKLGNTDIGTPAKSLRMNAEIFIDYLYSHFRYHFENKPRDYREVAHKNFIATLVLLY